MLVTMCMSPAMPSCAVRSRASVRCHAKRPLLAQGPSFVGKASLRKRVVTRAATSEAVPSGVYEMSAQDLKAALLDSIFSTKRGLNAMSEERAEINELITQLEAKNPTPSPTENTREVLDGTWKLVYTSALDVLALLATGQLPLVDIGDITQTIDTTTMTVENKVQVSVPFSRTSFSTKASIEVRSPKRLQVRYEEGVISTPELLSDVDVPDAVTVMGQSVDLSQVKTAMKPVQSGMKDVIGQVANLLAQQPDLKIPIQTDRAQQWLLTTYLDEDTRISRGDGGSVYVLVKDVSFVAESTEAASEEPPPPTTPTATTTAAAPVVADAEIKPLDTSS